MKRMLFLLACLIMMAVSIPAAGTPVRAAPALSLGDMVTVINTSGIGLAVRDAQAGNTVTRKYDGTSGSVIGGPEAAVLPSDGRTYTWWKVRWGDDATEGWSADSFPEPGGEDYLQKQTRPVSTKFSVGQRVRVVNMGAYNYRVRTDPPALYITDTFKHEGDAGTITDLWADSATYYGVPDVAGAAAPLYKGPANDYFYHFWKIQWDDGQIGWSAEGAMDGDYLVAISEAPTVSYIEITPESSTILNGYSQSYAVEAFDQDGNSLGDVTSSSVIWAVCPGSSQCLQYGNKLYGTYTGTCAVWACYAGKYDKATLDIEEHTLPYIHGWALDDSADDGPWPDWEAGLPNCSVYLDGVLATYTDENGHFVIPNLSPRVYEVRMQPPPGYYPWEDFWTVEELDATGGRLWWWRFKVQTFSTFEFDPIGDQVSWVPFPVSIWVRDRLGNLDTSYSGKAEIYVEPVYDRELPPGYYEPYFIMLDPGGWGPPDWEQTIEFTNGVWAGSVGLVNDFLSIPVRFWVSDVEHTGEGPFGSSGSFKVDVYSPVLPNLRVIEPFDFPGDIPAPFEPNVIKIRSLVENVGTAVAENVEVSFKINGASIEGSPVNIGSVGPGGAPKPAEILWRAASNIENATLEVEAHSIGQEDGNPSDNTATQPFSFYFVPFRHDRDAFSFENWYYSSFDEFNQEYVAFLEAELGDEPSFEGMIKFLAGITVGHFLEYFTGVGGHCYGMALSSALWKVDPSKKPLQKQTFDMSFDEAKAEIIWNHWGQAIYIIAEGLWEPAQFEAQEEYNEILTSVRNSRPCVLDMLVSITNRHSVTAYKILDLGTEKRVYVYDNNFPLSSKEDDYYITFEPGSATYVNPDGTTYWMTFAIPMFGVSKETLTIVKDALKLFLKEIMSQLKDAGRMLFRTRSPVSTLLTDQNGRRIGYVGSAFVNEIPGAEMQEQLDSCLFYLPTNLTYSVELTGTGVGTLGLDLVVPLSNSEARVAFWEDIPVYPGSEICGTFGSQDVTCELVLAESGEVLEPDATTTVIIEGIVLNLKTGWNMVSVPVVPVDGSAGAVFPGVAGIFTWNATGNSYYIPTAIEPEKGYWVAVTENSTIPISGTPICSSTTGIRAGWNMIGSVNATASIVDPNDDPDGSVITPGYWWDPASKSYILTTDIEPGKGYWLASVNDCVLTLP